MKRASPRSKRLTALLVILGVVIVGSYTLGIIGGDGTIHGAPHSGDVIYIQPLGDVNKERLAKIEDILTKRYRKDVKLLPRKAHPSKALVEDRSQYDSGLLRTWGERKVPGDAFRYLVVTEEDMFTGRYNFVFGQASLDGKVTVVSLHRLIDPRYSFDGSPEEMFDERLDKLLMHELGHNSGLSHCNDERCLMHFANSISELDRTTALFCDICATILNNKGLLYVLNDDANGVTYAEADEGTGTENERETG